MRSKKSTTADLQWSSPLSQLSRSKKPSAHLEALDKAGIKQVNDLLWLLPLRLSPRPELASFTQMREGEMFLGEGKIIHLQAKMAFGRRVKGRMLLHDIHLVVKDKFSDRTLSMRVFNAYPNQKKQLETLNEIVFLGIPQEYKAQVQIINPRIFPASQGDPTSEMGHYIAEYPTVQKVPGNYTAQLIKMIPESMWSDYHSNFQTDQICATSLTQAFQILHGIRPVEEWSLTAKKAALERIIYEEFFVDQLKILTRRKYIKAKSSPLMSYPQNLLDQLNACLPFKLTNDQAENVNMILEDMQSGHPMMRMIQGDVGCGKTIVAFLVGIMAMKAGHQVAMMCPTEALANQHFQTFQQIFSNLGLKVALLTGSLKKRERSIILEQAAVGSIDFVIGTHALIQEDVIFARLGLAVIDEQHKFGVEQRLKLTAKGQGTHCLIMSATPIPRTLSLAQYGDLDFSTIRTMPAGRKGIKSRIVIPANYDKYLEFLRARLNTGEQGYFVFPAIEESEKLALQNVTDAEEKYRKLLPHTSLAVLHGQMKSEEKQAVISLFEQQKIQLLISTSVIEVGINVPNASFMCVYNPERFGLSSLHQLRGRVGRGEKAGFFFMVLDKDLSQPAMERLEVVEQTTDGFKIAEADLEWRGEGDLFGIDQSGETAGKRVANIMRDSHILEQASRDIRKMMDERPQVISPLLAQLAHDQKILDTI